MSITPFNFTSWNVGSVNWENVGGTIAANGSSASFNTNANPFFIGGNSLFFGCLGLSCDDSTIGARGSDGNFKFVAYDTPANALASMTMTAATPVPFESNALPVIGATLFMAGGSWLKNKHSKTVKKR